MSDVDEAELDYAYLAQNALRGVVREVLSITENLGAPPGEHHYYIEFLTRADGVELAPHLRAQYPERMTIVLQHQFENLEVQEDRFHVTLHFKGTPDRLVIPFAAVTQFADPSVNFQLQFPVLEGADFDADDQDDGHEGPSAEIETLKTRRAAEDEADVNEGDDDPDNDGPPTGGADVVSLDRFRKK